jgi:hypothetical protein
MGTKSRAHRWGGAKKQCRTEHVILSPNCHMTSPKNRRNWPSHQVQYDFAHVSNASKVMVMRNILIGQRQLNLVPIPDPRLHADDAASITCARIQRLDAWTEPCSTIGLKDRRVEAWVTKRPSRVVLMRHRPLRPLKSGSISCLLAWSSLTSLSKIASTTS